MPQNSGYFRRSITAERVVLPSSCSVSYPAKRLLLPVFIIVCIQGKNGCTRLRMPHDENGSTVHQFPSYTEFSFIFQCKNVPSTLDEVIDRIFYILAQDLF